MSSFERGSGDRPALSRCVGYEHSTEFAERFWATTPLLTRADELPRPFDDLFSADAADDLISHRALRTPFFRMAVEGSVLNPSAFTSSGGFGAEIADQVSSEKVLAEFAAGATIVLQGLHRTWPPLMDFTRDLAEEIGHPVQVNAYITPASSRGFDPHYDVHDVFVLQIAGEKHWTIHEPVHASPLRDQPWSDHREAVAHRAAGEPHIDAVFRPGDALYLPRGWIHSAEALGGTSIHLTIGVAAYTRADVAQTLISRIGDTEALRTSLPFGIDVADTEQLEPIVRLVVAELQAMLSADMDDRTVPSRQNHAVSAALARRLASAAPPEPVLPLATVDAIAALSGSSVVRWRRSLRATITSDTEVVRISVGGSAAGHSVVLPAEATEAIRRLAQGDAIAVEALPGLDADSALVVVRRLLREAIIVLA
ncbi:cupin domain-containing protein [Subtercola frigoramans]|uniref:Ribosomal protein L16 Arg81 hydroxylase n=1 Tax=Subtercola frigoramans TaxID=120298 RepID=A0ABS2L492_9MICO|nr:cupin domain-containing protein [Subtercola frigoramans]MBM7471892.1 ribosomal protein L16 Arg81 hydroxylase [Subtercola frigoramans]